MRRPSCIILLNKHIFVVMALYNHPKTTPRLIAVDAITFFLRQTAHFYRESDYILANLRLLHSIFPAKVMIFRESEVMGTFHLAAKVLNR